MAQENPGAAIPDVKYWPVDDVIYVACPTCGVMNLSRISIARDFGEYGRLDICKTCNKDFVLEAFPDGVQVWTCAEV